MGAADLATRSLESQTLALRLHLPVGERIQVLKRHEKRARQSPRGTTLTPQETRTCEEQMRTRNGQARRAIYATERNAHRKREAETPRKSMEPLARRRAAAPFFLKRGVRTLKLLQRAESFVLLFSKLSVLENFSKL